VQWKSDEATALVTLGSSDAVGEGLKSLQSALNNISEGSFSETRHIQAGKELLYEIRLV